MKTAGKLNKQNKQKSQGVPYSAGSGARLIRGFISPSALYLLLSSSSASGGERNTGGHVESIARTFADFFFTQIEVGNTNRKIAIFSKKDNSKILLLYFKIFL